MRLFSLFKAAEARPPAWPWPPCTQPRTLSFRTTDDIFRSFNSESSEVAIDSGETPDSFFTNSLFEPGTSSTASDEDADEQIETVIQGLRAERLFFKLGETSSILEEAKDEDEDEVELELKECVVLAMDSRDPYLDFRKSMAEMMEAHSLRKWKGLEQLLFRYLSLNGENSHGYILEAFADSLVSLAFSSSSSSSSSSSAAAAAFSCCRHCRRMKRSNCDNDKKN